MTSSTMDSPLTTTESSGEVSPILIPWHERIVLDQKTTWDDYLENLRKTSDVSGMSRRRFLKFMRDLALLEQEEESTKDSSKVRFFILYKVIYR